MNPKDIIDMDYKIGDKVRIKRILTKENGGGLGINSSMMRLAGTITTIKNVGDRTLIGHRTYSVFADNGSYRWTEGMFENEEIY